MAIAHQASATPITLTPEDLVTISCATNRLVGHFGYVEQDREDVEHDLIVDLLERLQDYDPAKAKRSTFAKDCVEHQISKMIRARGRQCRDSRRVQRIDDEVEPDAANTATVAADHLVDPRSRDEERHVDLRLDVTAVLSGLTQQQRDICALLPDHTPNAITSKLGLSRRVVYREVATIRAAFAAVGRDHGFAPAGKVGALAG